MLQRRFETAQMPGRWESLLSPVMLRHTECGQYGGERTHGSAQESTFFNRRVGGDDVYESAGSSAPIQHG